MKQYNRQQNILQAAGSILAESGIEQLTIKNLASRVGLVESGLYRHFSGKEEILMSLLEELESQLGSILNAIDEEKAFTPLFRVEQVLTRHLEFLANNPHFLVAVFSEGVHDYSESLRTRISRIMSLMRSALVRHIQDSQDAGFVRLDIPAGTLAQALMGSMRLLLLEWRMSRFDYDIIPKGHQHIAHLILLITLNHSR